MRKYIGLLTVVVFIMALASVSFGAEYFYGAFYASEEEMIESFQEANIDWRQFEGTEINFIGNAEPNQESIMQLISVFESLTGIQVTYELVNEEILRQQTTVDLTARTGVYDAMLLDPGYISLYVKGQGLENLGPFLDNPELTDVDWYAWPDDFPERFLEIGQVDEVQYGLPLHLSGTLMMYRKDLYEEKGLTEPAKTMDELWEHASILHNPDEDVYGIAMRGMAGAGLNMFIWSTFLKSFGGDWFDDEWKPILDSPEAIEAAEFYSNILLEFGPSGVTSWEWSKILSAMQTGQLAITIDTPAFGISIENPEVSQTAGKWGYAPQPAGPAGITMGPYSWYVGINPLSKNKEAAWLFITWMTSKEVQTAIGGPTIYVSRLSVNSDPRWQEDNPWLQDWQEALMENVKHADPDARPRIPEYPEIGNIAGVALEEVLSGQKDAATAFKEVNERALDILERAGYYQD